MRMPDRKFWERLGFDTSGSESDYRVHIPAWAWILAVLIALLILRAILNVAL